MPQLFANNAAAMLASTISDTATQLTVEPSMAAVFRVANTSNWAAPSDWFKVTLEDADGNNEIIYVGLHASGSPVLDNLLRGQEGTTARGWVAGEAIVESRLTRSDVESIITSGFGARTAISTNAVDFNSVTVSGDYPLAGNGTWSGSSNAPTDAAANGQLNVYASGDFIVQELATFNPVTIWRRAKISTSWSNWYRMDAADATTIGRALMRASDKATARALVVETNLNLDNYGIVNGLTCLKTGEALPLTDIGPIWHADFASIMYWQAFNANGANYTGYASQYVGRIEQDSQPTARTGKVKSGFLALAKTVKPQLWNWALHNGLVVPLASWTAGRPVYADNGDGTFKGPDIRGEWPRFWDDGRGVDAGRLFTDWKDGQMPSHFHNFYASTTSADGSAPDVERLTGYREAAYNTSSTGGTENNSENRPRGFVQLGSIQL